MTATTVSQESAVRSTYINDEEWAGLARVKKSEVAGPQLPFKGQAVDQQEEVRR